MKELDDWTQRTKGFLSITNVVPIGSGLRLEGQFDRRAFSNHLFDQMNISRPVQLQQAVEKRQAEFLAGRLLAAAAQTALGRHPVQIGIGPDRAPIWPVGLAGSISHSGDICACLLMTKDQGLPGIDVERIARGSALKAIMEATLADGDAELLDNVENIATVATLCFSAKETLFKSLYPLVGRFFGFECARLAAVPTGNQLYLQLTEDLTSTLTCGMMFDISYKRYASHVLTWRS